MFNNVLLIITPLTIGCLFSQHFDFTLPNFFLFIPIFSTCPPVVKHFLDIEQIFLEGNFNVVDFS